MSGSVAATPSIGERALPQMPIDGLRLPGCGAYPGSPLPASRAASVAAATSNARMIIVDGRRTIPRTVDGRAKMRTGLPPTPGGQRTPILSCGVV
jgi:hypothetical protein